VFAVGPAGTGKTFLAVAYGVALLKEKSVQRLVISRPILEAGEKIGFLPGDIYQKVDPFFHHCTMLYLICWGQRKLSVT